MMIGLLAITFGLISDGQFNHLPPKNHGFKTASFSAKGWGHFAPEKWGHFGPERWGQFSPEKWGQFGRNFHLALISGKLPNTLSKALSS
jgi:hypothetical protein